MTQHWKPSELSPLGLAFIGDAIWEVYARQHCLNLGVRKPNDLHKMCTNYVSARAQTAVLKVLMEDLTEEEQAVVRRGRNSKSAHIRKNVDVQVYRYSTGFEALIGFLHGSGRIERLQEVASMALLQIEKQTKEVSG